jgi:hypothetical protein
MPPHATDQEGAPLLGFHALLGVASQALFASSMALAAHGVADCHLPATLSLRRVAHGNLRVQTLVEPIQDRILLCPPCRLLRVGS